MPMPMHCPAANDPRPKDNGLHTVNGRETSVNDPGGAVPSERRCRLGTAPLFYWPLVETAWIPLMA